MINRISFEQENCGWTNLI